MFTLQIPRCPGAGVGPPPGEPPEADPPEGPPEDEVGVVSPPPHWIDTRAHSRDATAIALRNWHPLIFDVSGTQPIAASVPSSPDVENA
jgi:hypothetical protein